MADNPLKFALSILMNREYLSEATSILMNRVYILQAAAFVLYSLRIEKCFQRNSNIKYLFSW